MAIVAGGRCGREAPPPPIPSPVAVTPAPVSAAPAPQPQKREYVRLTFDLLAGYEYRYPDTFPEDGSPTDSFKAIPASIKALSGQPVSIQGYMVPMSNKKNDTTRFLVSKLQCSCCFRTAPKTNEYVDVRPKHPEKVKLSHSGKISVRGILTVKEAYTPEGWVESIYQMEADEVGLPAE
jgi:hypothetical protein